MQNLMIKIHLSAISRVEINYSLTQPLLTLDKHSKHFIDGTKMHFLTENYLAMKLSYQNIIL